MRLWPHAADEYHPLVLLSWLGAVLAVIPLGLWLRRRAPSAMAVWALWSAAPGRPADGRSETDSRGEGSISGTRLGKLLALALLVALVAHDIGIYLPLWGKDQIYDPVTWGLTKYLRMIPNWGPGPPLD